MGFEVDFLPVGEGEKSGDAIAIRCGNLNGSRNEQFVMVIDGGTLDSGMRWSSTSNVSTAPVASTWRSIAIRTATTPAGFTACWRN